MNLLKYSFSLTPPAVPEAPRRYDHPEFLLDLQASWRQIAADDDDTLTFQSDADGAAIVIAVDLHDIPDDQAQGVAEQCMRNRLEAIRAASAHPVQVLQQGIRPHGGGAGLEMSFIAQAEGEHVHLHLGYVTSHKLLSFSMICQPDRPAAVALFNATVPGFRPRLP